MNKKYKLLIEKNTEEIRRIKLTLEANDIQLNLPYNMRMTFKDGRYFIYVKDDASNYVVEGIKAKNIYRCEEPHEAKGFISGYTA